MRECNELSSIQTNSSETIVGIVIGVEYCNHSPGVSWSNRCRIMIGGLILQQVVYIRRWHDHMWNDGVLIWNDGINDGGLHTLLQ